MKATGRLSRCLAPGGTLVVYGLLSSPDFTVPAADLVFRDITLRGYWFTPWFDHAPAEDLASTYAELGQLVVDGTIRVAMEATYPMERVRDALAHAAMAGRSGKVLLLPNPKSEPTDSRPPTTSLPKSAVNVLMASAVRPNTWVSMSTASSTVLATARTASSAVAAKVLNSAWATATA